MRGHFSEAVTRPPATFPAVATAGTVFCSLELTFLECVVLLQGFLLFHSQSAAWFILCSTA